MDIKIKAHLVMLATFILCNTASKVLVTNKMVTANKDKSTVQIDVVSGSRQLRDDVVSSLPSYNAVREVAHLRSKRFEWLGNAENGIAEEEHLAFKRSGAERLLLST